METAEMRRSTLQRKDREELTMIATTLGRKPSSRARKGEIIDLILDLAAGGDGSGGSEADASSGSDTDAKDTDANDADANDTDTNDTDANDTDTNDTDTKDTDAGETGDDGGRRNGGDGASGDASEGDGGGSGRRRRRRGREREANRDNDESFDGEPIPVAGHLELRNEGYGFLRVDGALPSKDDAYVPVKMVRQFGLRKGDHLVGTSRPANRNEKNPAMVEIESVNGGPPDAAADRLDFDTATAVFPTDALVLAGGQEPSDPTARVVDVLTPLGKGQRALLAAPPRTGATTFLRHVIRAVEVNHPDVEVFALLLDQRPEEITETERWVERTEVFASGFDRPAEEQVTIAEMMIERAKRLAESGRDVVVVVDGITRLARAYAQEAAGNRSGVTYDSTTIHPAKRFLGAARNLEDGGSVTMLATIAVDSDSDIDAAIYEELAGTANAEIRLTRAAAVRRVFPAVDPARSATLHEERLRTDEEQVRVTELRREIAAVAEQSDAEPSADLQALLARLDAD